MYTPKKLIENFRPELVEFSFGLLLIWLFAWSFHWPPQFTVSDFGILAALPTGLALCVSVLLSTPGQYDRTDQWRMYLDMIAMVIFALFAYNAFWVYNYNLGGCYVGAGLMVGVCSMKSGAHYWRRELREKSEASWQKNVCDVAQDDSNVIFRK